MTRWTKAFPSYSTLYTYLDVDNWTVGADRVTFDIAGGVTSPYYWNVSGLNVEVGWWESGTYHSIGSGTVGYNRNGGDVEAYSGSDFFGRQAQDRTVYLYAEGTGGGTAYAESTAYTVPHLAPAVNWAATDPVTIDGSTVTLVWQAPALEYSAMCLEVSIDGGSWSQFLVLWNTATSAQYTVQDGHSYQFRIRSNYLSSYSAYDTCATVISTMPTIDATISSVALGGTQARITVVNSQPVDASNLEYQLGTLADGEYSWSAGTLVPSQSSTNVRTVFDVDMTAYTHIRVRFSNSVGDSGWSDPYEVVLAGKPSKPTWLAPTAPTVDKSKTLRLQWLYSNPDGSAQTAYRINWYLNGSLQTPITGTGAANYHDMDVSAIADNAELSFRVQTRGVGSSYSDASELKYVTVYSAPTVNITSPVATVDTMPIVLTASYSDMAGFTCQSATASLQKDGRTLFSEAADINGSTITASLGVDEFLPTNGESYTVVLDVRSSSGLSAIANATFAVDFDEPVEGVIQMTNDPDTGYVSILATFDNEGADTPAVSISVARVNPDGSITPLITDGASGSGIVDRYAPLNTDYQYAVTTKAASQAVKTVYIDHRIDSLYWFAYWGEETAKAKWNPSGSVSISRPEKRRVHYVGREYPVSYDSKAIDQVNAVKFTYLDNVDGFVRLMRDGGRGVYKGCDGSVFHADFDFGETADYTSVTRMGELSLTVYRIEGAAL